MKNRTKDETKNSLQIFQNNEFGEIRAIKVEKEKLPGGFRIIKGYDNLYCINPFGDIISPAYVDKRGALRKMRRIVPTETKKGYQRVALNKNGKQKRMYVHRLVAKTFIPNEENRTQINHKDGNKLNNHISNLEWCTNQENIIHSYKTGLRVGTDAKGERNTMARLSEEDVMEIRISNNKIARIANKFGVSKSCIYKIKQRKRWAHV